MKRTKLLIAISALVLLSGCSTNRFAKRDASATYISTPLKIVVRSQEKNDAQIDCSKRFALLQKLNTEKFSNYRYQFDEINDAYFFYKRNSELMNKDSKELMASILDSKLDMVCTRVDNASFVGIFNKMKKVMDL
ncbi:hypothetical protein [Citrobacter werkmanii]|uniref:hypothetical protein n=1 Tax=Citrobacter werkmanii TaxID=67827 RepID=UPI00126D2E4B|nr:hypothetical protein [Salmonella enterica]EAZ9261378.1 hypothetical protein [Salmonella enterica]EBN2521023.1 hypothetical protein [Salmonella enterica]